MDKSSSAATLSNHTSDETAGATGVSSSADMQHPARTLRRSTRTRRALVRVPADIDQGRSLVAGRKRKRAETSSATVTNGEPEPVVAEGEAGNEKEKESVRIKIADTDDAMEEVMVPEKCARGVGEEGRNRRTRAVGMKKNANSNAKASPTAGAAMRGDIEAEARTRRSYKNVKDEESEPVRTANTADANEDEDELEVLSQALRPLKRSRAEPNIDRNTFKSSSEVTDVVNTTSLMVNADQEASRSSFPDSILLPSLSMNWSAQSRSLDSRERHPPEQHLQPLPGMGSLSPDAFLELEAPEAEGATIRPCQSNVVNDANAARTPRICAHPATQRVLHSDAEVSERREETDSEEIGEECVRLGRERKGRKGRGRTRKGTRDGRSDRSTSEKNPPSISSTNNVDTSFAEPNQLGMTVYRSGTTLVWSSMAHGQAAYAISPKLNPPSLNRRRTATSAMATPPTLEPLGDVDAGMSTIVGGSWMVLRRTKRRKELNSLRSFGMVYAFGRGER